MAGAFEASTTQAQLHNFIVGTAGTEAEQARRRAGFQFGAALASFLKPVGLQPSIIVKSGGGIHIHFTLSRALTRNEWEPHAHSLAEAGKRHGLKADYQVTIDSARLLRIPGTQNNKQDIPRPDP